MVFHEAIQISLETISERTWRGPGKKSPWRNNKKQVLFRHCIFTEKYNYMEGRNFWVCYDRHEVELRPRDLLSLLGTHRVWIRCFGHRAFLISTHRRRRRRRRRSEAFVFRCRLRYVGGKTDGTLSVLPRRFLSKSFQEHELDWNWFRFFRRMANLRSEVRVGPRIRESVWGRIELPLRLRCDVFHEKVEENFSVADEWLCFRNAVLLGWKKWLLQ